MLNPVLTDIVLTKPEYERYARHLILPHIGIEGQKRLRTATVLCVGVGGLGSACLLYLAAAGIHNIGVIDNDTVEISNLQRQIVYKNIDIGYSKIERIQRNLQDINPECKIKSYHGILDANNSMNIIPQYDIIIDGTDNFKSKQIISNACYIFNKPHIYGAISEFEGQVSVFNYQGGPNYRDLHLQNTFQNINKYCSKNGVLGVLTGIIGTLQATEVLKIVTGINNILSGSILVYNALHASFKVIRLRKKISSMQLYNQFELLSSKSYTETDFIQAKSSCDDHNTQVLLIDIRRPCEYKFNHIKDSINIPLRKLKHKNILSFLTDQSHVSNIYIYCNTTARSNAALSLLLKYGITSYRFNHVLSKNNSLHNSKKRRERDSNPR
uniref:Probable molybdopterin-synthase adenylyltransferase n=1 Tax=Hildenbrandia rubra TaxID=31481 RepID=A0A1C9CG78_9FLOR|nr:molybdopterin biosynthesis protein [Hildenbrandia rubra]AOM67375.1 molybdopterin biosynthesis protein [Hildenbrandia rubra]